MTFERPRTICTSRTNSTTTLEYRLKEGGFASKNRAFCTGQRQGERLNAKTQRGETVLIGIANAPKELRQNTRRGVRLFTAGAPPAAVTIERVEGDLGWELTQVYGLTETSPFITICEARPEHLQLSPQERAVIKARQGVELITSDELIVVDINSDEVPHDGETIGEIVVRGNAVMKGYYNDPAATAAAIRDGWFHSGDPKAATGKVQKYVLRGRGASIAKQ